MNELLSESWQRFVREEVQAGRFPSEAAVLEEALGLLKRREDDEARTKSVNGIAGGEIGEMIDELMSDLPVDVLERLPVDGAAQHNHYVYGTPKRTSSAEHSPTRSSGSPGSILGTSGIRPTAPSVACSL